MLKLRQSEFDPLRRHAEQAYPQECCGALLGTRAGNIREVRAAVLCTNTQADSPQTRYSIDPRELVRIQREARERGWEIVGFYHSPPHHPPRWPPSHPDHPARWAPTDLEDAHWIGCSYVIVSVEGGRAASANSFVLTGTREEDKALSDEEIVIEQLPFTGPRCQPGNLIGYNRVFLMLRFSTAGESHGEALIALLSGMPAGLGVDLDFVNRELWRRQQGHGPARH